jgi:hypothetical protein
VFLDEQDGHPLSAAVVMEREWSVHTIIANYDAPPICHAGIHFSVFPHLPGTPIQVHTEIDKAKLMQHMYARKKK